MEFLFSLHNQTFGIQNFWSLLRGSRCVWKRLNSRHQNGGRWRHVVAIRRGLALVWLRTSIRKNNMKLQWNLCITTTFCISKFWPLFTVGGCSKVTLWFKKMEPKMSVAVAVSCYLRIVISLRLIVSFEKVFRVSNNSLKCVISYSNQPLFQIITWICMRIIFSLVQ